MGLRNTRRGVCTTCMRYRGACTCNADTAREVARSGASKATEIHVCPVDGKKRTVRNGRNPCPWGCPWGCG